MNNRWLDRGVYPDIDGVGAGGVVAVHHAVVGCVAGEAVFALRGGFFGAGEG